MVFQIEIPDELAKSGKKWGLQDLLSCSSCSYKTPDSACYVTHMFTKHGRYYETDEEQVKYDNQTNTTVSKAT